VYDRFKYLKFKHLKKGENFMKRILVGMALALILFSITTTASNAQHVSKDVHVFAWTDKAYYRPGEEGTLTIVVVNKHPSNDYTIKNITIIYPWWPSYIDGKWIGNDTITEDVDDRLPYPLSVGKEYKIEWSFKVPSDGRVKSGTIEVIINAKFGGTELQFKAYPSLSVDPTLPLRMENLDKIMILLIVQEIIIIVSVVILASVISRTRRQREARVPPQ